MRRSPAHTHRDLFARKKRPDELRCGSGIGVFASYLDVPTKELLILCRTSIVHRVAANIILCICIILVSRSKLEANNILY
jgi:hypothetical protein